MPGCILSRTDLSDIVRELRLEWAFGATIDEILKLLQKEHLLAKAEFTSKDYRSIVRYLKGEHSPIELALSLQRDSFLSHGTALVVHGIDAPTTTLYVNREQSPKYPSNEISQGGINLAFRNKQRESRYIFTYASNKYVLLSGKHTGRAGVKKMKASSGELVDVTDIERTLIDIIVRPAYAGGIQHIADVYVRHASSVDINHMIDLLKRLDHAYPYHQSIGFLLERAGYSDAGCVKLEALGKKFDFYLDYGMKHPKYNTRWRLHYPASLS
jgi:hypothetical protein